MMSRRKTLPSLSSSRQMMMAWNVSGLWHRPGDHRLAAGLDALGDRDLALAREQLHRAHFAQIHAHRIIRALDRLLGLGLVRDLRWDLDEVTALALGLLLDLFARVLALARLLAPLARLLGLDHVHAHLAEQGQH